MQQMQRVKKRLFMKIVRRETDQPIFNHENVAKYIIHFQITVKKTQEVFQDFLLRNRYTNGLLYKRFPSL